ncbi:MAG: hypothetical protein KAJ19_30280, partial [Gammaproteobacteria bacterium]|nr:hypothetical protein [Gammaproteobacteria bacterium]
MSKKCGHKWETETKEWDSSLPVHLRGWDELDNAECKRRTILFELMQEVSNAMPDLPSLDEVSKRNAATLGRQAWIQKGLGGASRKAGDKARQERIP